ncbi:rod shape-determining protein MreD [Skermanella rosea]|uniref:rod shape-determining protein MreD n=1 Tax=Skermanella rosea TaxID=1817965 RepID=UPI001933549F|nr:rod shape-determining protein MreD [Skermanella rosea]UEM04562.1 rod shape-determining protein MreD [Skermanella rosea]
MTGGFWSRIDQTGRNMAPLAITAALMLVGMVPLHLPNYAPVAPMLPLMAVYYWVIHRPDLLRPSMAFGLGLLQDLLSGAPLGMTPLIHVLVYWVVLTQRRFFLGTSFAMLWFGFALVAFGAGFVGWLAWSILNLRLLSPNSALMQSTMTVAVFPLFGWLFIRIHRAFLQA